MPLSEGERLAILELKVERSEAEIANLEKKIEDKAKEEKRLMIWGLLFLGGIVLTLGQFIWRWLVSGMKGV